MTKTIILNNKKINYELNRKNVKNLNLRIKPDGTISVSVNNRVSQEKIDSFLTEHSDFIFNALKKYEEIEKNKPKENEFKTGEAIKILGTERTLKVEQSNKNSVTCDKYFLTLNVKNVDDFELKKNVIEKWKKKQATLVVTEICEAMYPYFQKYVPEFPQIKFRKMVSRWGSCQPKSNILTFNTALIETPVECIEYVVAHEFTHFLEANHSKNFYNKLERIMPDWKKRKKKLNNKE
ncbi:MAG: M48 family metallopeptidase [Ruminococcaceae bacterium]|nr:M48 family metallopeptidase [Oscillospiraceae bacterium]